MNNTEKRRAEGMINSWAARERGNVPTKPEVEAPDAKDMMAFNDAIKTLKELGKTYAFENDSGYMKYALKENTSLRRNANSKALAQWEKDKAAFAEDIRAKVDRLVAEVWDGKHTFDSLAKELV